MSSERYPSNIDQDPTALEAAIKENAAPVLARLDAKLEANYNGSDYLDLEITSVNKKTGLGSGLLLVTDRTLGSPNDQAAYRQQHGDGPLVRSYCIETMRCIFVQDLSPGNLNVKTLEWSSVNRSCRLSEEGSIGSIYDVLGGNYGFFARAVLAARFNVDPNSFLMREGNATPDDVDAFFREVLGSGVLYGTNDVVA